MLGCLANFAALAQAQNAAATPPKAAPKSVANEDYRLRIVKKRIVEAPFERSAQVALADPGRTGVSLSVGFGVVANQSAISLRGVFGDVKLRASLASIEAVLDRHRRATATPVAPRTAPPIVPVMPQVAPVATPQ